MDEFTTCNNYIPRVQATIRQKNYQIEDNPPPLPRAGRGNPTDATSLAAGFRLVAGAKEPASKKTGEKAVTGLVKREKERNKKILDKYRICPNMEQYKKMCLWM